MFLDPCLCPFYRFDPGEHLEYGCFMIPHLFLGLQDKLGMSKVVGLNGVGIVVTLFLFHFILTLCYYLNTL